MIVDSSAIVAVLLREPGYQYVRARLEEAALVGIGAPTLTEAGLVLSARRGIAGRSLLLRFMEEAGLVVIPFGEQHARVALEAFWRFGRGRHPAGLNYGDCMTYATARLANEPLLCIGEDFPRTDLQLVPLDLG